MGLEVKSRVYQYEGKPYLLLFEGKLKLKGALCQLIEQITGCNILLTDQDNNKWIDIVAYKPLYEGCEFPFCVKLKDDFYTNYKPLNNDFKYVDSVIIRYPAHYPLEEFLKHFGGREEDVYFLTIMDTVHYFKQSDSPVV